MLTATYSPDDNKLRLYASTRLDPETYAKVRAAGFIWAPKQDLFVAPTWTPTREDLLIELCGTLDDEDTSLVDRAEERAERFEDYSEKRAADSTSASNRAHAAIDGIPPGQPILVGHHSERHHRAALARHDAAMNKSVSMWKASSYWSERATSAIRHAKYKERPDVRARRIKGLESDLRKVQKRVKDADQFVRFWKGCAQQTDPDKQRAQALHIANFDHCSMSFPLADYPRNPPASQYEGPMSLWSALDGNVLTPAQAAAWAIPAHEHGNEHRARWIAHYENRLAYERAMLAESGGTVADRTGPEIGGACRCWASPRGGWSYIVKVNKVSVTLLDNWGNGGTDFTRTIPFDKLSAVMAKVEVEAARNDGRLFDFQSNDTCKPRGFILRALVDPTN